MEDYKANRHLLTQTKYRGWVHRTDTGHPHLNHGYAVTSHNSQGATADRLLVHVDTERAHEKLINRRLAYVSISRGRYDPQIYTNDAERLGQELSREISKRSALEIEHEVPGPDRSHPVEHIQHHPADEVHESRHDYGMEQ